MIETKTNQLRLLDVQDTASRRVARAETQKMADFIHHWLYGIEPPLPAQPARLKQPCEQPKHKNHDLPKTYLN